MSTYAQIQSNIADKIVRSDLTTQIADEINRAIQFYSSKRFYFTQTTDTFTTVASQASYSSSDSVATDIRHIDLLKIAVATNDLIYPERINFTEIQQMNTSNATGEPSYYAYYQQKIWFYVIPNAAWTVTMYYQKAYADLSSGSDTNDWTSGLPKDLIEQRVLSVMYADWTKDDESAARAKAREQEIYAMLKSESNNLLTSSRLKQECI